MTSLEDILHFLKQEKEERMKQRILDIEERVKQREQDMNIIKEMISKGVNSEVMAFIDPVSQRQEKLEDEQKNLQDKVEEMFEMMTVLKKRYLEGPPPMALSKVRAVEQDSGVNMDNSLEMRKIVSSARRTIGLQCIYPVDVSRQMRLNGAKDETEARFLAVKEFLWCEMRVEERCLKK